MLGNSTFDSNKNTVLSYMDKIDRDSQRAKEYDEIRNTTDYKLRFLGKCKDDAKNQCLNKIMCNIYKDAIPLSDDYKAAYSDDIDKHFKDFISNRCDGNNTLFYIKEGLKRNNPFCKKVLEAVDSLINKEYIDKEIHIDDMNPEDLIFKSTDDIQQKLNVIGQDMSSEEIANAIRDNVKQSAISEITRAKEAQKKLKDLENELANDPAITNQTAVESAMEKKGLMDKKFYEGSLFESVMIGKTNAMNKAIADGSFIEIPSYNALKDYKESTDPMDYAFIETVKEYTALNMIKALKLEPFTKSNIMALKDMYTS